MQATYLKDESPELLVSAHGSDVCPDGAQEHTQRSTPFNSCHAAAESRSAVRVLDNKCWPVALSAIPRIILRKR